MKTLLLMRHAKSSWKDADLEDHDRPLSGRGKRDAPLMGRLLAREGIVPERVVCSTARRARATARRVLEAAPCPAELVLDPRLYMAGPEVILEVIHETGDEVRLLMIIGHNPGLEMLAGSITGADLTMPTAALVRIDLKLSRWRALLPPRRSRRFRIFKPRDAELAGS